MKIVQGNDILLNIPFVAIGADGQTTNPIPTDEIADLTVSLTKGNTEYADQISISRQDNLICLAISETLPRGSYSICITGKYENRDICYNQQNAFELVRFNSQSDYTDHVAPLVETLDTALFVSGALTDEGIIELRRQLGEKTAEAEAARTTYDTQAAALIQAAAALSNPATLTISPITNADLEAAF